MSREADLLWVSEVTQLNDLHDFMQDEQLDRAMAVIIKLYSKTEDLQPGTAAKLLVELSALSAKFALLASYYANVAKGNTQKKNVYYSVREALDKLVDSLKYIVRTGA